jgi:FkbM family methyltransferase
VEAVSQGFKHRLARAVVSSALLGTPIRIVKVRNGPLTGARLAADFRDERWYWLGTFEPDVQEAFVRFVVPGSVVYDAGAHAGFLSLLAQRLAGPKGFVVAAEADPILAVRLAKNLSLNGGAPAHVVASALGDRTGEVALAVGRTTYETRLTPSMLDATVFSPATTIDTLVATGQPPPSFVKIDVEGNELATLRGASRTIESEQPTLVCELHRWGSPAEVVGLLLEMGYGLMRLPGDAQVSLAEIENELTRVESVRVLALAR